MRANQVCMLTRARTGLVKTAGARVVVLREWSLLCGGGRVRAQQRANGR